MKSKKKSLVLGLLLSAVFCQGGLLALEGPGSVSPKPGILPTPTRVTPPFQGMMPPGGGSYGSTPIPTSTASPTPAPGSPAHFVPGFIVGHAGISGSK